MNHARFAAVVRQIVAFFKRKGVAFHRKLPGTPKINWPFWKAFGKRLLRATPVIVGVLVITGVLERVGWLKGFETTALDSLLLLKEPLKAEHVRIVGITEEDYKNLFDESSPLQPSTVREIIDAIAKSEPTVIGIDLDTSPAVYQGFQLSPSWPRIVWARTAVLRSEEKVIEGKEGKGLVKAISDFFSSGKDFFTPYGVLGGREMQRDTGIALPPYDPDGMIRRYRRVFSITDASPGMMDSFPWAIVKAYREVTKNSVGKPQEEDTEPILYSSVDWKSFTPYSASYVLERSKDADWTRNGPFKNKVVLLGGLFSAARDEHLTRLGPRSGVEIMAQVIEAEVQEVSILPPNKWVVILLQACAAVALILLQQRFQIEEKFLLSLFVITFLALLCSLIVSAFSSLALWAAFVPILLAVLIQQLQTQAATYRFLLLSHMAGHVEEWHGEWRKGLINHPEQVAPEEQSPLRERDTVHKSL
ncbi:MAG TPA: CHASE2 domain-containing protein [Candidatus Binatia bacterium]|jgi:CHASE2 domain-containing sensor protein|nr:CHASE2 domain-containing protein [Candidatus Binatia bacterium]